MNVKGIDKQGVCVDTKAGSNDHIRMALIMQLDQFSEFINKLDDSNKLYKLNERFAEILRNTEMFL